MHAISSYRGNRPTNKQTYPQTNPQTGPITIHCAAKLSAQCNQCKILSYLSVVLEKLAKFLGGYFLAHPVEGHAHDPFHSGGAPTLRIMA